MIVVAFRSTKVRVLDRIGYGNPMANGLLI